MNELVNLQDFILELDGERYRSFVVHDAPATGKSQFAKMFAESCGGKYLDLLTRFGENEELKRNIDIFNIDELEKILVEEAKETKLLVLDNVEFLLNTWANKGYELFFRFLEKKWDSFRSPYRATLGVFLITNQWVCDQRLKMSSGTPRVLHLKQLESLGSENK